MKPLYIFIFSIIVSSCAYYSTVNYEETYGPSKPQNRQVASQESTDVNKAAGVDYWNDVKPILESRCVSCHGCYDAPCQLKLTAIEGLERGASKTKVYDHVKLGEGVLTRLFEDAHDTESWREKGFYPVLNEHKDSAEANRETSSLYQLLTLKELNPLPTDKILSEKKFPLGVERPQVCPKPGEIENFKENHPLWGMPYALPGLPQHEQDILKRWVEQGAKYTKRKELSDEFTQEIAKWEHFLNQDSLKSQLSSRYIYEHLFIAHVYFDELSNDTFFKVVRSSTPPGEPVNVIAVRRPYDDPGVERVYYRIIPENETILTKTHMTYAFNEKRKALWQELFLDKAYDVESLPSYALNVAGNPFKSFEKIPMQSRYKFLLSEANFTIMNFIKGPVCSGQSAVNVIRDHFWVFFINPDLPVINNNLVSQFIQDNADELSLSNTKSNSLLPLGIWVNHSEKQRDLLMSRNDFIAKNLAQSNMINLNLVWDGDNENDNAGLTVFRHFDSATVEKGLIGKPPETAWLISYSLLERIHYLLVAGYDVYGNVGHQLLSRMHMDFLRIESEANFLYLLPEEDRNSLRARWYRGSGKSCLKYVNWASSDSRINSNINFTTDQPKNELYDLLKEHLGSALAENRSLTTIASDDLRKSLQRLETFYGEHTMYLPEMSLVKVTGKDDDSMLFTLLRNNAHSNVTSIFDEKKYLLPSENTVSVVKGVIGSYPNALFNIDVADVDVFVDEVLAMESKDDYEKLVDMFGLRRTNPKFWEISDEIHNLLRKDDVTEYGVLDYNRLENR